jgi:protein involved in polysaccharide export with SLBB domain
MNRYNFSRFYKYFVCCIFSLSISLPSMAQVVLPAGIPTGLPTSIPTGTGPGNTGPGNLPGTVGTTPNASQQAQIQEASKALENAKNSDSKNSDSKTNKSDGSTEDGDNQSQSNSDVTNQMTPEWKAREELRRKLYGYSIFADKSFNPMPSLSIATPINYVVGPNDELNIYIFNYAEATYKVVVTKDGFVNIPRVGNVYVAGRTIEEVRKIMIDKLSRFVPGLMGTDGNSAQTKLMVTLGNIRTVRVYVSGEVVNPSYYEITSLASAFNALHLAGGPTELGTFRDIRVVRQGKVVAHLDVYDFLTKGELVGDVRVQDNDNILVGYYKKRVEITGQVKRPGLYELKDGETLGDVIRYAGGFNEEAYKARMKLQRITPRERKLVDIEQSSFDTFDLVNGDIVNVETILDRFENIVTLKGAVMREGDYALENSASLKQLIDNAEGLREDAFVGRVNVLRTKTDLTVESIPMNYADILNGRVPDLMLQRLDIVVVPSKFDLSEPAYVAIDGEVNNPKRPENDGKFSYMTNMTLEDLIMQAGGLKESAMASDIQVVRRKRDVIPGKANSAISEVFNLSVSRDLSMNKDDSHFLLLPYDEVIVRKSPNYMEQQSVFLEGEVLMEGKWTIINKNDKISDVIKRAGGLTELADPEAATLYRRTFLKDIDTPVNANVEEATEANLKNGIITGGMANVKEEKIGIELLKILKNPGSFDDLIVQEGDIIRIPKRLETIKVNGEVLYATTVKYGKGMHFTDYISQSGGFTSKSLKKSSFIKYANGSVDRTRRFMFFNVYPKVKPGAEIFVPQRGTPAMTPQQLVSQTSTLLGSILSLVGLIIALSAINK